MATEKKTLTVQSLLKRPGGTKIDVQGKHFHFVANENGDEVCEIEDPYVLHRLINEIPSGYALYGDDAGKKVERQAKPGQPAAAAAKAGSVLEKKPAQPQYVTKPDGTKIDLMALDKDELTQLAQGELGVDVQPKWKPEAIRAKIVEAIRVLANADE